MQKSQPCGNKQGHMCGDRMCDVYVPACDTRPLTTRPRLLVEECGRRRRDTIKSWVGSGFSRLEKMVERLQ